MHIFWFTLHIKYIWVLAACARSRDHSYVKSDLPTFIRGIEYTETLAGPDGMWFHLWPATGTSVKVIQGAARELRQTRDVVGSITWDYRPAGMVPSQISDSYEERDWARLKNKIVDAFQKQENREKFLALSDNQQKQIALGLIDAGIKT